ncbi:hypothetical protein [Thalassobacillus sp. C254]|nr:hypothetical protein [Thalassobacillus sp. C254]
MNNKQTDNELVKEAITGLTIGIIMMIVAFSIAHYVFGMPFFPN